MKLASVLLISLFCLLALSSAQTTKQSPNRPSVEVIPGQIVIKFKDSVAACVHCLLKQRAKFHSVIADHSDSLDKLQARFDVISATPVFRTESEEQQIMSAQGRSIDSLRNYHHQKLQLAIAKFPNRARRVPKDASLPELHHIYVLTLSNSTNPVLAAREFRKDPHVEYAHPNYVSRIDVLPNDPFYQSSGSWGQNYSDLWALKSDKLNIEPAWSVTQGEGILVGVVDTGVDYKHPDLAQNIWTNPAEIPNNGKDDDGNGYVDDVRGWNFVTCKKFGQSGCEIPGKPGNDVFDDNRHGTHVSGTIAAVGNNKLGIIGVAPKAKLLIVKSFNSQGSAYSSEAASGMLYAAENGIDVMNNSWGCGFCPSVELFEDAMRAANAMGVVVVFAAGNSAADVLIRSPQNMHSPKPIVVAASDQDDLPTFFTNFGAGIDVAAPGGGKNNRDNNILSLKAKGCKFCGGLTVANKYLRLQGTSMSTPHVAGLAALLLSQHPSLKSDELRQIVRASSDDIHFPGFDAMSGSGRINAARAIQTSSTIQVAITSPKHISVVNSKSIEIRGTALGQNFKQMQLFYSLGNQNEWNEITVPRNRPAQNEALGRWELSSLPLGWKLLRLEALDRNGLKFEDVINVGTQIKTRSFKKATNGTSFFPRISGNLTVWVEGNFQIGFYLYLYDKKTNKKIRIGDKRYTNPDICISGNFIAWNDYILDQRNIHICVYDAKTATCPVQRLTTGILTAMSGNRLVYDLPGSIVTYDISQKSYKTIGSGTRPDIDGDHVIWQKHIINTDHNDIALYDLRTNTERMLTNTTEDESYAKISGKWVVFRRRYGNGDYYNFVSYNLETGKETVIEDIPLFDFSLSDKYLIWASYSGPIVLYNLETNKSEEIVIYPQALRKVPFVSGSRIIWTEITDYQNGMGGIHTAVLPRRFQ